MSRILLTGTASSLTNALRDCEAEFGHVNGRSSDPFTGLHFRNLHGVFANLEWMDEPDKDLTPISVPGMPTINPPSRWRLVVGD